jgi:hypothetical protein
LEEEGYCLENHQEEEDHFGWLHPHHYKGKFDKHRTCQNSRRPIASSHMSITYSLEDSRIHNRQEDTLMELSMFKDMDRWYDKAQQAIERVAYIGAFQQIRDKEEHGI